MNQSNSREVEYFRKNFIEPGDVFKDLEAELGMERYIIRLIETHRQQLQKARLEALQEAVNLADKIELREPDGGTKQWMAFKAFRNTLRDRIKDHSDLDQEVSK